MARRVNGKTKDYGIMALLPSVGPATLRDLFRFLLLYLPSRPVYLLSFFRFFFWKKLRGAKRGRTVTDGAGGR